VIIVTWAQRLTAFVGVDLATTVAMHFIGWLLHQAITERTLRSAVKFSRLHWLKVILERITRL